MNPHKRRKLENGNNTDDRRSAIDDESDPESLSASDHDISDSDDYPEIKPQKSKQTSKRKIRATGASKFGETLQSLLKTDVPSSLPLSLKPSIARKRNDEKLETKAHKVLQVEKKEKEDKGRIKDIIGGWGGESERALRKVAQRGVVKLFNAIQQSQASSVAAVREAKETRGSGRPTLAAPTFDDRTSRKKRAKDKDNIIGRGKESTMNKNEFFDVIRSGGIVSKV